MPLSKITAASLADRGYVVKPMMVSASLQNRYARYCDGCKLTQIVEQPLDMHIPGTALQKMSFLTLVLLYRQSAP